MLFRSKTFLEESNVRYVLRSEAFSLNEWFGKIDLYAAISTSWESDSNSLLEAVLSETSIICSPIQNYMEFQPLPRIIDSKIELENFLLEYASRAEFEPTEIIRLRASVLKELRNPIDLAKKWINLLA